MKQDLVQLSRTLSYALRHHPESLGLQLDTDGWVDLQILLDALSQHRNAWKYIQEADILELMAQADKQRFELKNGRIRAYYGHTLPQKIERVAAVPPTLLYHGTTSQAYVRIQQQGLRPMGRQYVHLSAERETALQVAKRRKGPSVILKIAALKASLQGIHFYLGNDMVWLADSISPEWITVDLL